MITNKLDLLCEYEAALDSPATPKHRKTFFEERIRQLRAEVKNEIIGSKPDIFKKG